MRVADGNVVDCTGCSRFGEHAGERRTSCRHGFQVAFIVDVQGALQRFGELPVARVVVFEFANQGRYGFQVHVIGEHVFVEDGDIHATQCVWEVTGAGGLFAEFGG